jgi:hypothetical protein
VISREQFQKNCSHTGGKRGEAVFLGFGFVLAQSQATAGMLLRQSLAKTPKILAPHGYSFFENALKFCTFCPIEQLKALANDKLRTVMSAISSFSSAMNVYQTLDRNSFAQSAEAVAGTQQPFPDADGEMPHEDRRHREEYEDDEMASLPVEPNEISDFPATNNSRYVLNVTA